jgi:hypothetical protein
MLVFVAGAIVILGRLVLEGGPRTRAEGASSEDDASDMSFIRGWLAISLVGGLLIFVAVSFWLDDTTLRSTLVGGVVASASAAVAFYFATQQTAQAVRDARRDILAAAAAAPVTPDLQGRTSAEAAMITQSCGLWLITVPSPPDEGTVVIRQAPAAGSPVGANRTVTATFAPPAE